MSKKNKYNITLNPAKKNTSHMGLAIRIKPKQRVLELGCSSGYLSKYLKEELECHIVGVEIDDDALQQASVFCEQTIIADLDNEAWLAEIEDQQFDVVLCADVLEHLKDPAHMLKSLKPFLHAQSILLVSLPNVAHASVRLELIQGHFEYESLGILDDTHLHFYTRDSLISMLKLAGYECCDISYTTYDLADEAITLHLGNAGLEATDAGRELLHAPEAVAYQYIAEARPAQVDLEDHLSRVLPPKPLVSSGAAYHDKQLKIDSLESQLVIERQRHQDNIRLLTDQNMGDHPLESAYCGADTAKLDDALFLLSEQLQHEQIRNNDLSCRGNQLESTNAELSNDVQRLEQVLQRVHRKQSYRLVRFVKDLPRVIKDLFYQHKMVEMPLELDVFNYDAWRAVYRNVTSQSIATLKGEIKGLQELPKIAVLLSIQNPDKTRLINTIESILQQAYQYFELCIASDNSMTDDVQELLRSYQENDKRVKIIFTGQDETMPVIYNSALSLVETEHVAVVVQHDQLSPDALFWVAKAILQDPDAQLIYTDEDKIDPQGKYFEPYFKPDWNPELFLSHDYISHLAIYKTRKVRVLGGFNPDFEGAQEYDLALRYVAELRSEQIIHIPRVLYHWAEDSYSSAKVMYEISTLKAVECALEYKQRPAIVSTHKQLPRAMRVRYLLPDQLPLVSIIIPTRNGFHLLYRCVESIFAKTIYTNYELIIIDNGSDDIVALRYLQRLQQDPRVTVIRDDRPFNYSALNNNAVEQAKGELIALLNNDLEVINDDWLGEMVSHVLHPEVGAVGAKLYYPDDTIQHAGLILGLHGVAAGHAHKHLLRNSPGYCGRLLLVQKFSAVTAACMLVRKNVFCAVGGFDEQNLSVAFNDVDLCLRIQEQGYQNVWTPYAELYHHESASRGYEDTPEKQQRFNHEIAYMQQRWNKELLVDPAYNPNLTLDRDDFSFAWPPRI